MEIKKVRVHTCNQKMEGHIVDKCRCRKFITVENAEQLIEDGYARNITVSIRWADVIILCPICAGEVKLRKRCHACKNTGEVSVSRPEIITGEDIYMRPFLKTPRTATIEEEHIEYAFIKGDRAALRRIEQYGNLNQRVLGELGAEVRDQRTGNIVIEGKKEPENDKSKGQGRKYDYGRTI